MEEEREEEGLAAQSGRCRHLSAVGPATVSRGRG